MQVCIFVGNMLRLGAILLVVASCRADRTASLLGLRGGDAGPPDAVLAALFDFDGTLVQSEETHRQTFERVLSVPLPVEYWNAKCVGTSPRKLMEAHLQPDAALEGETLDETIDRLLARRAALFEEHIDRGLLEETAGAGRLLRELRARGVRCACVTSGSRGYVERAFAALGIADDIELIVAGDDEAVVSAGRHKPHPFPYEHAARGLGVEPRHCVAFEDSLAGIRSAQAAGMRCVALKNAITETVPGGLPVAADGGDAGTALAAAPVPAEGEPPADLLPVHAFVADFDELPRSRLGL